MVLCSAFTPCAVSSLPLTRRLTIGAIHFTPHAPSNRQVDPNTSLINSIKTQFQRTRRSKVRFVVRAEESSSSAPDVDAIVKDLTEKWDKVENKSSVAVYGLGAIAVLYVTSSIVGAVNSIPLLPKFLELVGFIYSAWFVYRYLLFKSSREELSKDVDELKSKITGQEDV